MMKGEPPKRRLAGAVTFPSPIRRLRRPLSGNLLNRSENTPGVPAAQILSVQVERALEKTDQGIV
jgi:hypothetical protein